MMLFHPGKLFLFTLLSLADLVMTWYLIKDSPGLVYESNPIAEAWFGMYGFAGLALCKGATVFQVGSACLVISIRHPQVSGRLLNFACLAVAAVVLYSFSLVVLLQMAMG